MNEAVPIETVRRAQQMFQDGSTYREISEALEISMSLVSSVLTSVGGARDKIIQRRLVMNQMAADGVYVEDIAVAVGLQIHAVKNHLRKARISYQIKPKGKP